MISRYRLAEIAALLGDPTRAGIVTSLWDGRARPAGELARSAGVVPATASGHLARLVSGGVLRVEPRGRHRYFRLAGPEVADAIETLARLLSPRAVSPAANGAPEPIARARMCYDHVAGRLGVTLADALREHGHVEFAEDGGVVTPSGEAFFAKFGIDLSASRQSRRVFCRPCIDWSERRAHLAGAVGAAMASRLMELRWVARKRDTRALTITPIGWSNIERTFGCSLHDHTVHARPPLRVVAG